MTYRGNDRQNRRRRGQAMLESALVLMATLAIILGIVDFGQVLLNIQMMNERARDSARWASTHTTDAVAIKNYVAYGRPAGGGGSGIFGLRPEHVTVRRLNNGTPLDPNDDQIEVTIRKPMTFLSPYIAGQFMPKPAIASSPVESLGATE